jgi:Domain of unknown function (DUF427)
VRADDQSAQTPVEHQTFCPYKGLCSYDDADDARLAVWSYRGANPEVVRISDLVSFEPDMVSVQLDGTQLRLEPGQTVIPHGPDRDLTHRRGPSPRQASMTDHPAACIRQRAIAARLREEGPVFRFGIAFFKSDRESRNQSQSRGLSMKLKTPRFSGSLSHAPDSSDDGVRRRA